MGKVAKLVYATTCVRVIVEDTADEEEIIAAAELKLPDAIIDGVRENIDQIVDDLECPYGSVWMDNEEQ